MATPYEVSLTPSAKRELAKLSKELQQAIEETLNSELAQNPKNPTSCAKLVGYEAYRIRTDDYRIVFTIDEETSQVHVLKIAHRKEVYTKKHKVAFPKK